MRFHSPPLFSADIKNQKCGNMFFHFNEKHEVSFKGIDVKNWRQSFRNPSSANHLLVPCMCTYVSVSPVIKPLFTLFKILILYLKPGSHKGKKLCAKKM